MMQLCNKALLTWLLVLTQEERKRVLHFVVVGGGPTGVEFAGTLK